MQLTKSEAFSREYLYIHFITKYQKKHNNSSYPISLVFLPFVEKQALLLENLTMEVRYYVALADPLFFFVCGCVCVCVCVCVWKWGRFSNSRGLLPGCSVCHKRGYEPEKKITRAFRPLNHPSYCNISYDVSRCCLKHVSKYNKLEFNQCLTFLFFNIIWPKNSNLSMGEGNHV